MEFNKIERTYENVNDQTCVEYTMYVPIQNFETVKDKWGHEKISKEAAKKYLQKIHENIDYNKEICEFEYFEVVRWLDGVRFEITTREKDRIELENKIKKILGMDEDDELDIDPENRIYIWGELSKKELEELENKLPIIDWKVYFVQDYGCMIRLTIDFDKL